MHSAVSRFWKRFVSNKEGSVTVELAFFCTAMMFALVPLSDMAGSIHSNIQLTSALRAGMMYGLRNPNDSPGIERVIEDAGDFNPEELEVEQEDFCECGGIEQSCDAVCDMDFAKYKHIQVEYTEPLSTDYPEYGDEYRIVREISFRIQ